MALRVAILTSVKAADKARMLYEWLGDYGDLCFVCTSGEIPRNTDLIVSYNYDRLVRASVLRRTPGINLHIGYLPWNKGAHPVLWSALQRTPMGVTIHWMDEHIDTGEVIVQQRVQYNEHDTLRSIYDRCHRAIRHLFMANWHDIREKVGNCHRRAEMDRVRLPGGWDTTVQDLREANRTWSSDDLAYAERVAYGEALHAGT